MSLRQKMMKNAELTNHIYQKLCKEKEEHEFMSIACKNHKHTIKVNDTVCKTPFNWSLDEFVNHFIYILSICNGQDIDIIVADSKEEAIQKGILDNEW